MHPTKSTDINRLNYSHKAFVAILICAQIACASTASCVKALPAETPSVLRGLWRQTLTSVFFSILSVVHYLHNTRDGVANNNDSIFSRGGSDEMGNSDETTFLRASSDGGKVTFSDLPAAPEEGAKFDWFSPKHVALVALTVVGATLQNDAIVIALHYASSAAVMCLCNTSEFQHLKLDF